eukprot:3878412-Pyramimonas_sp.AAC.1
MSRGRGGATGPRRLDPRRLSKITPATSPDTELLGSLFHVAGGVFLFQPDCAEAWGDLLVEFKNEA